MRKNLLALMGMVALLVGATAAHAAKGARSVEYGIEASSDTLLLPSASNGSVVLTCSSCRARSYQLTDKTTYLIGKNAVSFSAFGSFLRTGGVHNLTVFVKLDSPVVTRISVAGQ